MQNLRDKLLKAGLVSEADSTRADQESKAPKRPPREAAPRVERPRNQAVPSARPEPSHRIPRLPELAVPGTKAHQRLEALKHQERDKKLRDLVQGAQVPIEPGTQAFHFVTRKGKLRRMDLSENQAKLLAEGKLSVVERQEPASIEHSLVPPETAEAMMAIYEKSVRFLNRGGDAVGFLSDEELAAREAAEAKGESFGPSDEGVGGPTSAGG